jgi:Dyp-type peroxidase family
MTTTTPPPLDLNNIQGDILVGLPKKTQTYAFYQIANATEFRKRLSALIPFITTSTQAQGHKELIKQIKASTAQHNAPPPILKLAGINIAFSHNGLHKLGLTQSTGDSAFDAGMLKDSFNLGDKGTGTTAPTFSPDWIPAFKAGNLIDVLILFSGDSHQTIDETVQKVELLFGVGTHNSSLHSVLKLVGDVRPGAEKGHEHFGFLDGISQPAVQGVDTKPNPGQEVVNQGVILCGRATDTVTRPPWTLDGSFGSLRFLNQLVPEFDAFLNANPIPGLPPHEGSDLFGARLVGRWKSGAPIDITPTKDDPALGADPLRNNNFQYDFQNPDDFSTQTRCPFAAHTRKTNPRNDLNSPKVGGPGTVAPRRIIRRGIPFGPEVTPDETKENKTIHARGLIFFGYSANIELGFQFIQHSWANNTGFPIDKTIPGTTNALAPGFDPIIGQQISDGPRQTIGLEPQAQLQETTLPTEWVVPQGGEYFFSPSISALKNSFALPAGK